MNLKELVLVVWTSLVLVANMQRNVHSLLVLAGEPPYAIFPTLIKDQNQPSIPLFRILIYLPYQT